jgi:hypothetical protein
LRKDKELKNVEFERGLIKQEEVCSCGHESESFLDEVDIEFKKNLMKYSDNDSHLRELMNKSSKGSEESRDFKTNVMCVDTGKYEVSLKQEIDYEDQDAMERNEASMSHNEDGIMLLQYGTVEQKIVLRDNEENEAVKYDLKL